MGNVLSAVWSRRADHGASDRGTMDQAEESENEECRDSVSEDEARVQAKEQEMAEFMKQLNAKREQRREILARHRAEKKDLEASLDAERKAKLDAYETNRQLRELLAENNIDVPESLQSAKENADISHTILNMKEEFERLRDSNIKLRLNLAETNSALQSAYSDIADLQEEHTQSIRQIGALKEVVKMSKTMINLREGQLTELKNKLNEIEQSLADREASMLSTDLRNEYVRQLQNMRTLRGLYEERARLAEVTKLSLTRDLEEQKELKEIEIKKCNELKARVDELEAKVEELLETIENKNSQISASRAETHILKNEMNVVNKLFSQVLLGYKNKQDLDKLVQRLEENHGLLTHMAEKENGSEASSALPKLLLELVNQIDEGDDHKDGNNPDETVQSTDVKSADEMESSNTTAEEIVENLPKVWKVLIELLSHQSTAAEENTSEKVTTCYKSVETKSGPVLVPSVSQTYIRLKDLILEKLALVKEVNRMKQLNTHLETRLGEQERRLCLVTTELSKTWHVVGRLKRHHHQLHTHEKILKYELQQKRKLLNELKEELEYCREKWEQAREKNIQSERDWKKLRAEFTSRKKVGISFNTSAESGYSDERPSDESSESNDESEYVTEQKQKRSKKKIKKSFENILDSSADFNLVAEREDPASDLLDVADLSLDTQDGDNSHDISDSCNSESVLKSERICEETEDEIADIANDSCVEETAKISQDVGASSSAIMSRENVVDPQKKYLITEDTLPAVSTIDPAAIMKSIKEQNERLAKKDKKLESLEKSGAALLKQTQSTVKISEQISETLDHLINRPSSSKQECHSLNNKANREKSEDTNSAEHLPPESLNNDENNLDIAKTLNETPVVIDPTAILKNIEEQKSRLAKKDQKLEELEKSGAELIKQSQATAMVREKITSTLDNLLNRPTSSNTDTTNDSQITYENENLNTDEINTSSVQQINVDNVESSTAAEDSEDSVIPNVDFKLILENVKKQNELLAKKDERLQKLESGCDQVVKEITKTLNNGEQIGHKLDALHDVHQKSDHAKPATSSDGIVSSDADAGKLPVATGNEITIEQPSSSVGEIGESPETLTCGIETDETTQPDNVTDTIPIHDIPGGSSDNKTVSSSLDDINTERDPDSRESSEPSTSSEMDHEARFAARDIRLKRLEEQTKSLVKRVNRTTSKGVKINYKLEELHNIYGSENSRAGTPSEDDRSQDNEDENDEE